MDTRCISGRWYVSFVARFLWDGTGSVYRLDISVYDNVDWNSVAVVLTRAGTVTYPPDELLTVDT